MVNEPPITEEELDRFFDMIEPALLAAIAEKWNETAGRPVTAAEIEAVLSEAFHGAAGNAIREVWGAKIGELIDGKKSQ
jgi:hypothetical protein